MKIKRRFPSYFTGFDETEHEVKNKEELMSIDWINEYKNIPGHIGVFYSEKYNENYPDYLIALSQEGDKVVHFVVGYIYGDAKELGLEEYKEFIEQYKVLNSNG